MALQKVLVGVGFAKGIGKYGVCKKILRWLLDTVLTSTNSWAAQGYIISKGQKGQGLQSKLKGMQKDQKDHKWPSRLGRSERLWKAKRS